MSTKTTLICDVCKDEMSEKQKSSLKIMKSFHETESRIDVWFDVCKKCSESVTLDQVAVRFTKPS